MGQKIGVNAFLCRGYNPSVLLLKSLMQQSSSPSIRSEAPSFIVARAAKPLVFGAKHQTQNVVRQSRTNILPKIHRGAEATPPQATELQRRVPQLSPLLAGCPHPSRRGVAPCHLPQRGRLRRLPPQSIYFPSGSALNHRKNGLSISVEHRLSSV